MFSKKDNNLFIQLSAAFGKKQAKKIIKDIEKIKEENPEQGFNFIFKEDGTFIALKKEIDIEEEEV